ncbi:hypothetical protein F4803DRAFT_107245 [Xylaria telfairii]|nr:hypothetical protein F4803DRAFT_107245 [Xylaria telfairii]
MPEPLAFDLNGQQRSRAADMFLGQQSSNSEQLSHATHAPLGPEAALLPGQVDWTHAHWTPPQFDADAASASLAAYGGPLQQKMPTEQPVHKDDTIERLSDLSPLRTPSQHPHGSGSSQNITVIGHRDYNLQEAGTTKREQDGLANLSQGSTGIMPYPVNPENPIVRGLADHEIQFRDQGITKTAQKRLVTFQCTLCPLKFTRAYNLRSHLRTHTDERPFLCGICGKAFTRQHDRTQHERLHTQEKDFVCRGNLSNGNPWGCGRRFNRVDALKRHFQSEAGRVCLKPLRDDDRSQCNQEGGAQEHVAGLESYSPRDEGFTLPAPLVAQYPALAQTNLEELWLSLTSGVDELSRDSGYSSDPATGFTVSGHNKELPLIYQPSDTLTEIPARKSARYFARCLASRSGAHIWGESVLAMLGHETFIFHLNALLTKYLSASLRMTAVTSHVSFKQAIKQINEFICRHFNAEMKSDHSSPEVALTYVGAMEPPTGQNKAISGEFSKRRLRVVVEIPDWPVSDPSFDSLSLLVRNLYSDPRRSMDHVEKVLQIASNDKAGTDFSRCIPERIAIAVSDSIEFVVETDLPLLDYIKQNFSNERVELSTLITLTGTAFYAYATTCLDYLKWTWPDTGEILLAILQEAIQEVLDRPHATAKIVKEYNQLGTLSIELCYDGALNLRAKGSKTFAVDAMQQLCWLTATFSTPPPSEENICYCAPRIEHICDSFPAQPTFRLETCVTKLHASERNSCWLSLFSNAVIAHGFPIPERADGMGLEMSVKLMAGIIGARHAATFDGGVVIKGFSSMFVPVMRTRDGIQWHYVTNGDPEMQLTYEEGVKKCPNRLLDLDLASLMEARNFIGWNSMVEVRVGDETNDFDNIEFSDAAEVKAALQIPGGSVGFQQFGLAQIDVTFGKRDGKCHFQRNSSYRRIVCAAEKMFVALFDTGERRSCLVPASGLLLHILRHRLSSGLGGVPASKIKISSTGSFTETLLSNAKMRLTSEEDEPLFVDDVVSEIWSVLELLQAQSISTEKNSKLEIHATWQERLLGYEYKAVVEDWSPMPLKELEVRKTCGGWPRLVRDVNALVLLANGFGDLIRPIGDQTGLCHQWKTLPRGKDYMAVPVKVLLGLYSLAGCRESKKRLTATSLALHSRGASLFQPCPIPTEWQCSCDRLQQVVSISSFGDICVPDLGEGNGAVIIGESGSLLKRLTKRNMPKITGILDSHSKAAFDRERSLSCNIDTSTSSTGSESSDFRPSNTSSPASSVADNIEASPKNPDKIGTGLSNFCCRGKRGLSEIASSISTISPYSPVDSARLAKQPCLGKLPCRENLLADGSRS